MFPDSKHRPLLILPVSLVVLTVLLLEYQGPYYLGRYFEDYPYLLNGLNILTFHAPEHIDHPGTTLQVLSAIVIFVKWMAAVVFGSWTPLQTTVLSNPESYLRTISLVLNVLTASAIYFAGRQVYQLTGSLATALVLQASPFLFAQTLLTQFRVQNEPLLTAAGLALTIPLAPLIFRKNGGEQAESPRLAAVAGIIFGFGVISKVTFAPLILMGLLFVGRRARMFFAASAAVSAFVFLLPVSTHFPRMVTWFVSLATHSERYGQGAVGLPATATLAKNIAYLYAYAPGLFWFLAYYLAVFAVLQFYGRFRGRRHDSMLTRVLLVGIASAGLVTAMTIKHTAVHYLVPALAVIPFLNAALFWGVRSSSLPNLMKHSILGTGLAVAIVSVANTGYLVNQWTVEATTYRDQVRRLDAVLAKEKGCVLLPHYRSSLVQFALVFGSDYAGGVHAQALARLFPNFVYFNIFNGQFRNFTDAVDASEIRSLIQQGRCVLSVGTHSTKESEWSALLLGLPLAPVSEESKTMGHGLTVTPVTGVGEEAIFRVGLVPASGLSPTGQPAGPVFVEAEDFATGTVVVDKTLFGLGIGVLTSPVYPARVNYRVQLQVDGPYEVYVRCASAESRPVTLSANGKRLSDSACSRPTGGWDPASQVWQKAGRFDLVQGVNHVELASERPFPHIDKLVFIPAKP